MSANSQANDGEKKNTDKRTEAQRRRGAAVTAKGKRADEGADRMVADLRRRPRPPA